MNQPTAAAPADQPSSTRKPFIAMSVTYFLDAFNDNFFKQAVSLLAVSATMNYLSGYATALFSLPFVFFSAWGGWLSDRFAKKQVLIAAKMLELVAMLIGAYGLITMNWACVLLMVFTMGVQSTLFGPAMNGSIPELYPEEQVTKANAVLKVVSTAAILLGTALAGFSLERKWLPPQILFGHEVSFGIILTAAAVILVAALGLTSCFGVYSRPASGAHPPFPHTGPIDSLREFIALKRDPLLLLAILCDCFFYFLSQFILLVNNPLGIQQLGLSQFHTSLLSASLAIGVSIGALVAAKITTQHSWTHILMPGAVGMGVSLIALGLLVSFGAGAVPPAAVLGLLILAGIFGGMFLIPITAFIQVRPDAQHKGRVLGVSYFTTFACMMLAGLLFSLFDSLMRPSWTMMMLGVFALLTGVVLQVTLRKPQFRTE
ncbi:MFS transporter [Desulfobulbus sp. F5]|nr:MFS transporter [Desulfobulbus sp. F5]